MASNTVVSHFLESQKCVLCNSSEVGVRRWGCGGVGGRWWGIVGMLTSVLFQKGVRFENLSSNNQVSAAGQVAAETPKLISNIQKGKLFPVRFQQNKTKMA